MQQDFKQSQNLEQGLTLTPQLKRSLEILQKPALELREMVAQELRTNPLLEDLRDEEYMPERTDKQNSDGGDFDDSPVGEIYPSQSDADYAAQSGEAARIQKARDFALNSIQDKISLEEYLLNEANIDADDEPTARAFAHLCGRLDDRGFLDSDAVDSALRAGFDKNTVDSALRLLRNSDPPGIGAFDMRDSLMLQLERAGEGESLAHRILERRYDLLMKRKVMEMAKLEQTTQEEVERAIARISKLHTSPAHEFSAGDEIYITPDLDFYKDADGQWSVRLISDGLPKLRINPEYRRMCAEGALKKGEAAYVREKMRDAKSVMDALEQRRNTLLKIGAVILDRQRAFFERGPDALQPMRMQEAADIIGIHATTVGRALAGKYAETPFGIFALKDFFGGGYEADGGASVASSSVKEKIRAIVESESPRAPMSDSAIASALASDGINIARRTVAKYREELGIAPKNIRRRF